MDFQGFRATRRKIEDLRDHDPTQYPREDHDKAIPGFSYADADDFEWIIEVVDGWYVCTVWNDGTRSKDLCEVEQWLWDQICLSADAEPQLGV